MADSSRPDSQAESLGTGCTFPASTSMTKTKAASDSPAQVYAEAQAASARGDLEALFSRLDRAALIAICINGINLLLAAEESDRRLLRDLCLRFGIEDVDIDALLTGIECIAISAERIATASPTADPAAIRRQSEAHRSIVADYQRGVQALPKATSDLPAFSAALERLVRERLGGGSVSTRLFLDETLENLQIDGNQAWATRRFSNGSDEDIGFIKRRQGWRIRLFARRRGGNA